MLFLTIIITILILLFCYCACVISSRCSRLKERKEKLNENIKN